MSYEKVRSIKIDEKNSNVFITSACNNVRPLSYSKWECESLSDILKGKGKRAVEIEILKEFEEGNFQGGGSKWENALDVLYYLLGDEYQKFKWNFETDEKQRKIRDELRKSEEFKELLGKCLDVKPNKEKWVITKEIHSYNGNEKVFGKRCPTCMKWVRDKNKATKYNFKKQAIGNIFLKYKDEWKVEELKCGLNNK